MKDLAREAITLQIRLRMAREQLHEARAKQYPHLLPLVKCVKQIKTN